MKHSDPTGNFVGFEVDGDGNVYWKRSYPRLDDDRPTELIPIGKTVPVAGSWFSDYAWFPGPEITLLPEFGGETVNSDWFKGNARAFTHDYGYDGKYSDFTREQYVAELKALIAQGGIQGYRDLKRQNAPIEIVATLSRGDAQAARRQLTLDYGWKRLGVPHAFTWCGMFLIPAECNDVIDANFDTLVIASAPVGLLKPWPAALPREATRTFDRTIPVVNSSNPYYRQSDPGAYVRSDAPAVQRTLPRDKYGVPQPDVNVPHTQLGRSSKTHGAEPQAREWMLDTKGRLVPTRDIDFSTHNHPDFHHDPHEHILTPRNPDNPVGGGLHRQKPGQPLSFP